MAKFRLISLHYLGLLSLLVSLVLSLTPIAPVDAKNTYKGVKRALFRVFWQDFLNVTDYIVLHGIPGVGLANITPVGAPYGTMYVFNDPLTEGPKPDSKVLGRVVGTASISSFDGLSAFSAFTMTFNTSKHMGSLSFLSPFATTVKASGPIVGGTEDFLFAQGYAVTKPVAIATFNVTYSVDLHVFWPPYLEH